MTLRIANRKLGLFLSVHSAAWQDLHLKHDMLDLFGRFFSIQQL